jgi:hypothetical protein
LSKVGRDTAETEYFTEGLISAQIPAHEVEAVRGRLVGVRDHIID